MKYIDKYPHCNGCPVEKYCGTMVSCTRLCNSYKEPNESGKTFMAISSMPDEEEDYVISKIELQNELM